MTPEIVQKRKELLEELKQNVIEKNYVTNRYVTNRFTNLNCQTIFCSVGFLLNRMGCSPDLLIEANTTAISGIRHANELRPGPIKDTSLKIKEYLTKLDNYFTPKEINDLQYHNDSYVDNEMLLDYINELIKIGDDKLDSRTTSEA